MAINSTESTILIVVAAFAGGIGGAGALAGAIMRGRSVGLLVFLSFLVLGFAVGLFSGAAALAWFPYVTLDDALPNVVYVAGTAGLSATLVVALLGKIGALVLRWKGIEIKAEIRAEETNKPREDQDRGC